MKRTRVVSLLAVLMLVAAMMSLFGQAAPQAAPAAKPAPPKEVKIGAIYPLSGGAAQAGVDMKAGIELAVEIVNGKYPDLDLPLAKTEGLPNLGGAKIAVVFADSQGKAEVGQTEAERLITNEKVIALLGCYHSAVTKTASNVAERAGMPFVNAESSSPDLTERGFKWFFRTTPNDLDFSRAIFDFIDNLNKEKNANIKTVSLLVEDTDFGSNSANAQKAEAQRVGVTVVGEIKYKANTTSLNAEVQKLKADKADVLLPSSYLSDAILTVKTMKELDYNPRLILAQDAGYVDASFITTVAKDGEGIASRAAFSLDIINVKPVAKRINDLYRAKTGKDLTDAPARSFTGMLTLAEAINRAASTDPETIRRALVTTDISGKQTIMPWKGIKFNDKGQNYMGQAIIVQLQGGKYTTVFPFEFKNAEVIFPVPAWSQRK